MHSIALYCMLHINRNIYVLFCEKENKICCCIFVHNGVFLCLPTGTNVDGRLWKVLNGHFSKI